MTNTSPTPETIEKLVQKFVWNDKDILGDLGSKVLHPGEYVDVTETVEVEVCEYITFTTTNEVIMNEPSNVTPLHRHSRIVMETIQDI